MSLISKMEILSVTMSIKETVETKVMQAIKRNTYFSNLSPEQMTALAQITHLERYKEGELIFREGDKATRFFIVVSGLVQVYKISKEGKEIIFHLFGPDEFFAELPVFGKEKTYPAYAMCLKPTQVLAIDGEGFRQLIENQPDMLLNVLLRFAQRLRRFSSLIEDLALRNVDSRLAKYILSVSVNTPGKAKIQIHKKTLAAILGTVPETLSRSFKKLADQGIIQTHEHEIQILDQAGLEKVASLEE